MTTFSKLLCVLFITTVNLSRLFFWELKLGYNWRTNYFIAYGSNNKNDNLLPVKRKRVKIDNNNFKEMCH